MGQNNQPAPATPISPKVLGSTLGGGIATVIWILVGHYWLTGLSEAEVTSLTGATSTVLAFVIGYQVRDPLRRP